MLSKEHVPLLKSFLPHLCKPVVLKQQVLLISFQSSPSLQISCPFHSYRILPCSLPAALFAFLKTSLIPPFHLLFKLSSLQFPMSHPNHMFSERLTIPQFLLSPYSLTITNPASFFFQITNFYDFLHSSFFIMGETHVFWDCKPVKNTWTTKLNYKNKYIIKKQSPFLPSLLMVVQCPHCSVYHSGTALCMILWALNSDKASREHSRDSTIFFLTHRS